MQIKTDELQKEIKQHGNYDFPFLVSHEKLSQYESGSFLWHWHPEIELTLVTHGQICYQINNDTFILSQGQALFGNSGTLHAGSMIQMQDCEYTAITFDPRLIYGHENSLICTRYVQPITQNPALPAVHFDLSSDWHREIIQLIEKIISIESEKYPAYELDLLAGLENFWKLLFLNNDRFPRGNPYDKHAFQQIRTIISYIEENYASDLTLENISSQIHVCRSECSRLFKKHMKLSLFEFITQYRIEKSIEYLTNTDYSITRISDLTGFHDSNYFTKVFRKQKGCSPSQFRKNSR